MIHLNYKDYQRIAQAIEYIQLNFSSQPKLVDIANAVDLSPSHFQKLFTRWAGVSPKQFTQFLSLEYAKSKLAQNDSIESTSLNLGYSSSSRLHDLFITIEGMTPGEYKNGGENLELYYSNYSTPFGPVFLASTSKGLYRLSFEEFPNQGFNEIKEELPNARLINSEQELHLKALKIFSLDWKVEDAVTLHLRGSEFQIKVWQALLAIPTNAVRTYSDIAHTLNKPSASRAVGNAVGRNPVAFIIPCHRVIQRSGQLGGYRWGKTRKKMILGWEGAQSSPEK